MNFTREPVLETIITARQGFSLLIRSSKFSGSEEYVVDAVEVVAIGGAVFYRSAVRPSEFLVPISDYEVVEQKEFKKETKAFSDKPRQYKNNKYQQDSFVDQDSRRKMNNFGQRSSRQDVNKKRSSFNMSDFVSDCDTLSDRASTVLSTLIPPPDGLVYETLSQNKDSCSDKCCKSPKKQPLSRDFERDSSRKRNKPLKQS